MIPLNSLEPERRDKHLEIKFINENQVDAKFAWGL